MARKFIVGSGSDKGKTRYLTKRANPSTGADIEGGLLPEVTVKPKAKKVPYKGTKGAYLGTKGSEGEKTRKASNVSWSGDNNKLSRLARKTKWKETADRYAAGRYNKPTTRKFAADIKDFSTKSEKIGTMTKKKKSPAVYAPFKMKAKDYGNSPMKKNFGEFGVKNPEGPEKVTPSNPLKFFGMSMGLGGGSIFKKARDMMKRRAEMQRNKAAGGAHPPKGGLFGRLFGGAMKPRKVVPHGDESHTGGAVGGEEEEPTGAMPGIAAGQMAAGRSGGGGGGAGVGGLMSDIRTKENIKRTGVSGSGIPIYEFNYIGGETRYSGTMAQDLLEMGINAVSMGEDGYYRVNYNNIDVDMHQIN